MTALIDAPDRVAKAGGPVVCAGTSLFDARALASFGLLIREGQIQHKAAVETVAGTLNLCQHKKLLPVNPTCATLAEF